MIEVDFEVRPVQLSPAAVFPSLLAYVEREDIQAAQKKVRDAEIALAKMKVSDPETSNDPETSASPESFRLARQSLRSAEAELGALKARWKADRRRYSGEPTCEKPTPRDSTFDDLKQHAIDAENRAAVQKARLTLLQSEKAVADLRAASRPEDDSAHADQLKKAVKALQEARKELEMLEISTEAAPGAATDQRSYTSVGKVYSDKSTGRRLALANWIVDRQNPLAARVAVNYVWMHHFGTPLVKNVFDFGVRSPEPRHRPLLDWLAVELMENNWSLKHLHRLLTGSRVYQLSSASDLNPKSHSADPDNLLYWRGSVRRLDAEVVRDGLLSVGGTLDPTLGGPEIDYTQGERVPRRSLYFQTAYEKQMTMLVLFDAAAPTECYRRSESIIPQQALALFNNPLAADQARRIADRLWPHSGLHPASSGGDDKIDYLFALLLGRSCSAAERREVEQFLESQRALLSRPEGLTPAGGSATSLVDAAEDPRRRARENLVHALLNHNDFVTIR